MVNLLDAGGDQIPAALPHPNVTSISEERSATNLPQGVPLVRVPTARPGAGA